MLTGATIDLGWVVVGLLILLVVASCGNTAKEESSAFLDLYVYEDRLTGCQYLSITGGTGVTPRMAADGKQICRKVEK